MRAARRARTAPTPPPAPRVEPYKSHLAYVKERRSDEDGEALLAEALARIEDKRTPRSESERAGRRPSRPSTTAAAAPPTR